VQHTFRQLTHGAILGGKDESVSTILRLKALPTTISAVSIAEPEPLISREEVVGMLFNIADIAAEAWLIRRLLEDDGEEEEEQGRD
jgi:hypothetical protein